MAKWGRRDYGRGIWPINRNVFADHPFAAANLLASGEPETRPNEEDDGHEDDPDCWMLNVYKFEAILINSIGKKYSGSMK